MALRAVSRYARDPAEAEDFAQEALLRAWRNRTKLRDRSRWRPWLAQIARNEALRGVDRRGPVSVEEVEDRGAKDDRLDALVEGSELQAALARLSEADREILRLRYEEDLTQPMVAERLGIPEGTAKVRLNRARKRLGEELGPG